MKVRDHFIGNNKVRYHTIMDQDPVSRQISFRLLTTEEMKQKFDPTASPGDLSSHDSSYDTNSVDDEPEFLGSFKKGQKRGPE